MDKTKDTAKKSESGFKRTVKKASDKTKAYVGKKTAQAKEYGRKYRDELDTAYDIGFQKGWNEAYSIPKRVGAKRAAAKGFGKGISNRYRADKYAQSRKCKRNHNN